jgi:acyl transferase domain-containing protein
VSSARIAVACDRANGARPSGPHRFVALGESRTALAQQLAGCAAGLSVGGAMAGVARTAAEAQVVFLFTGIGAEFAGMGRELFATEPRFRRALEECHAIYGTLTRRPLLSRTDAPFGSDSPLAETHFTQPAVFALEYALAELWRSWGVEPAAVMGHSLGEDAAACVAGAISLEDALRLVVARAGLMAALPEDGAMLAVFAEEAIVNRLIASRRRGLAIAAINAPDNVVVAGDRAAVNALIAECARTHVRTRPLRVTRAFHSALMNPMLDAFQRIAARVAFRPARIPLMSSVTGRWAEGRELADPAYWTRRIRDTVRFEAGIRMLYEQGFRTFVEIGPQATLLRLAARTIPDPAASWLPTVTREGHDRELALSGLATLFVRGVDVHWPALDGLPVRASGSRAPRWPSAEVWS